jgi:hypothetical protein
MLCEYCQQEHNGAYASGRFCSSICARGFSSSNNRAERNEKIRTALVGTIRPKNTADVRNCPHCGTAFTPEWFRRSQVYCSTTCSNSVKGRAGGQKSARSQSRRSKNEVFFADLCKQKFQIFENERMFDGWDADVIIPVLKVAVLWNGPWHRRKLTKSHSVLQVQTRDRLKIEAIKKHGYEVYVINDDGSHDREFVQKQFDKFCADLELTFHSRNRQISASV